MSKVGKSSGTAGNVIALIGIYILIYLACTDVHKRN